MQKRIVPQADGVSTHYILSVPKGKSRMMLIGVFLLLMSMAMYRANEYRLVGIFDVKNTYILVFLLPFLLMFLLKPIYELGKDGIIRRGISLMGWTIWIMKVKRAEFANVVYDNSDAPYVLVRLIDSRGEYVLAVEGFASEADARLFYQAVIDFKSNGSIEGGGKRIVNYKNEERGDSSLFFVLISLMGVLLSGLLIARVEAGLTGVDLAKKLMVDALLLIVFVGLYVVANNGVSGSYQWVRSKIFFRNYYELISVDEKETFRFIKTKLDPNIIVFIILLLLHMGLVYHFSSEKQAGLDDEMNRRTEMDAMINSEEVKRGLELYKEMKRKEKES